MNTKIQLCHSTTKSAASSTSQARSKHQAGTASNHDLLRLVDRNSPYRPTRFFQHATATAPSSLPKLPLHQDQVRARHHWRRSTVREMYTTGQRLRHLHSQTAKGPRCRTRSPSRSFDQATGGSRHFAARLRVLAGYAAVDH